jgi:hypothetical protein
MARHHSLKIGEPVWVYYIDTMTIRPTRVKATIQSVDGELIGVSFAKGQAEPWYIHAKSVRRRTETEYFVVYKDRIDGPYQTKERALFHAKRGMIKLSKVVNGKPVML